MKLLDEGDPAGRHRDGRYVTLRIRELLMYLP